LLGAAAFSGHHRRPGATTIFVFHLGLSVEAAVFDPG